MARDQKVRSGRHKHDVSHPAHPGVFVEPQNRRPDFSFGRPFVVQTDGPAISPDPEDRGRLAVIRHTAKDALLLFGEVTFAVGEEAILYLPGFN